MIETSSILKAHWEKKLQQQIADKGFLQGAFWGAEPEYLTKWQRIRRTLAYHLFRRWKNLRFGFYFRRDDESTWDE